VAEAAERDQSYSLINAHSIIIKLTLV